MAKNSLDETRALKVLLAQVRGFCESIQDILHNKDTAEIGRYTSFRDMAHTYNDLAETARVLLRVPSMFYTFNVDEMPSWGDSVWPVQKKILEQVWVSAKLLYSSLEGSIDFVDDEFDNLENFIQSRLRAVIFEKPQREVEVQNAIESLLLGRGLSKGSDYDRETGKFEFSGKEYIPDFIIPKLQLCIEVKLLRDGRKSKVIEEISADITAYAKQYERQLFVVYDLGVIQNEEEFRRDIENAGNVKLIRIVLSVKDDKKSEVGALLEYLKKDVITDKIEVYPWKSHSEIVDISVGNVDKWNALRKVCEHEGLSTKKIISIGDGVNDINMLQNSLMGICMKNAADNVKRKARYITAEDNNNNGACIALVELLGLSQKLKSEKKLY